MDLAFTNGSYKKGSPKFFSGEGGQKNYFLKLILGFFLKNIYPEKKVSGS